MPSVVLKSIKTKHSFDIVKKYPLIFCYLSRFPENQIKLESSECLRNFILLTVKSLQWEKAI